MVDEQPKEWWVYCRSPSDENMFMQSFHTSAQAQEYTAKQNSFMRSMLSVGYMPLKQSPYFR